MIKEGQEITKIEGPITRQDIKDYAQASGDHNPIHINDEFASKYGLNGVIAHGMLSFGFGVKHANNLALENNGELINIGCEMRGMLRPGDWLITTIKVKSVEDGVVEIEMIQDSKMPLKLEKDGEVIKTFEGEERNWVKEKEKEGIATEETEEGTLTYRRWLVNKGWGKIVL